MDMPGVAPDAGTVGANHSAVGDASTALAPDAATAQPAADPPDDRAEPPRPVRGLGRLERLRAAMGRLNLLDRVVIGTAIVVGGASAWLLLLAGHRIHVLDTGLDLSLDTTRMVISASVAVLTWVRFRERGEPQAAFQSAAFLALTAGNLFALLMVLDEVSPSPDRALVGPADVYVSTLAQLIAGGLIGLGGLASTKRGSARPYYLLLLAIMLALLAAIVLPHTWERSLPALSTAFVPGATDQSGAELPISTPLGTVVQLGGALLYAWAAFEGRRLYRRDGAIGDAYLTVGLVYAVFAQVHHAFYPGTFPGVVTSGDVLMVIFVVVLLLGIEAEARTVLRDLRKANRSLEMLRESESDRAVLEERARLSRELHDGLAQDLWLAKLKVGRLAAAADLPETAGALATEVAGAIDSALLDARQAVMALRVGTAGSANLPAMLRQFIDEFSDRFGLLVQLDYPEVLPRVAPRVEAELLRITQEALTNVRRHADATLVSVRVEVDPASIRLTVRDNGRGFDVEAPREGQFGIAAMRERAALIGARLAIDSRPSDGTLVAVDVPIEPAPAPIRARP